MPWNTPRCNSPNLSISLNYLSCPVCDKQYPYEGRRIICYCNKQPNIVSNPPPPGRCVHLGNLEGKVDCNCSYTRPVYSCSIHGVCCERPTAYKAYIALDGERIQGNIPSCKNCQERKVGQVNEQ